MPILQGRKVVKIIPSRDQSLSPEGQAGVSWVKETEGKHAEGPGTQNHPVEKERRALLGAESIHVATIIIVSMY